MKENHQSDSVPILVPGVQSSPAPLSPQPLCNGEATGIMLKEAQGQDPKKDQEVRLKFAEETHLYVREQIRLADQKATFSFASSTALLAYLHKGGLANRWVVFPNAWSLPHMLSFLATVGLLLCAVACLATVMPRLKGAKRGLVFFAAISAHDGSHDYTSEVMRQSLSGLCEAKLKNVYELSAVCKRKYDMLKWGQWLGAIGLIASLLLLILQSKLTF
jgi:hypothetical protein